MKKVLRASGDSHLKGREAVILQIVKPPWNKVNLSKS
jgi:hypothetical protein